jgi:hypothetical protein
LVGWSSGFSTSVTLIFANASAMCFLCHILSYTTFIIFKTLLSSKNQVPFFVIQILIFHHRQKSFVKVLSRQSVFYKLKQFIQTGAASEPVISYSDTCKQIGYKLFIILFHLIKKRIISPLSLHSSLRMLLLPQEISLATFLVIPVIQCQLCLF